MTYFFLVIFGIGLLLGVRAMLHGIERPAKIPPARPTAGGATERATLRPSEQGAKRFVINLPTTASFASVFGVTGYLLARYTTLPAGPVFMIAAVAGAAGGVGALTLVAKWAIPAARAEVIDERYVLQGVVAQVASVSDGCASGTITYQAEGASHTTAATGLDGARLELGTDVVIERIEGGVAYVEPWALVEARL